MPLPSSGAPEPLVLANEGTLVVAYMAGKPSTGRPDGSGLPSAAEAATIVVFRNCYASHFGPPNDEVFAAHPLADRGLRPYGAFEVENSSWLAGLERRNRAHPRHDPRGFEQMRHLVWTFHDSVLECGALSYAVQAAAERPGDLMPRMHELLRSG